MGGRVLTGGGRSAAPAAAGFTLIEVLTAMAITVVVMLANLSLFNTAQKNLAASRALTAATSLAADKIADFRALSIVEIRNRASNVKPSPNPLDVRWGGDTQTLDGVLFTRTWTVSSVDVDNDSIADMTGDLVKVKLDVAWAMAGKQHLVTMATFTTGKPE